MKLLSYLTKTEKLLAIIKLQVFADSPQNNNNNSSKNNFIYLAVIHV